jgi:hypothetical protein
MDERRLLLARDLAREIADGQIVVLVGAGVSIAASGGAPAASWTGLLSTGVERCEQVVPGPPAGWGERVRGEIGSGDLDDLLSHGWRLCTGSNIAVYRHESTSARQGWWKRVSAVTHQRST